MNTKDHSEHDASGNGWEDLGRAAEDFARRVARDAAKFAERLEEHAGEFARDVSRDWRRAQRHYRRASRTGNAPDVQAVFEDIRGVLSDVLDGVDELIARVFTPATEHPETPWVRVVTNRDASCGVCSRTVPTGSDVFARRTSAGMEYRCVDCGAPAGDTAAS